ncbi:hypothetical protein D9M69_552770 [compost metagenome]
MLKQIAVVTCNLNNEAISVETQLFSNFITIDPSVIDPACSIGRKISILGKNIGRTEIFF